MNDNITKISVKIKTKAISNIYFDDNSKDIVALIIQDSGLLRAFHFTYGVDLLLRKNSIEVTVKGFPTDLKVVREYYAEEPVGAWMSLFDFRLRMLEMGACANDDL